MLGNTCMYKYILDNPERGVERAFQERHSRQKVVSGFHTKDAKVLPRPVHAFTKGHLIVDGIIDNVPIIFLITYPLLHLHGNTCIYV